MDKMKLLFTIFCACVSINVSAKNIGDKTDTVKAGSWAEFYKKYNDPLFVLDGSPIDKPLTSPVLANLDPQNVLSIDILKYVPQENVYVNEAHDCVIIETKTGAIIAYQKKLGAFSREYQSYLESHGNKDDDILYVLNGDPIENKGDERISTLYKLSPEKIIGVTFTESATANGIVKKTVIIETKVNE